MRSLRVLRRPAAAVTALAAAALALAACSGGGPRVFRGEPPASEPVTLAALPLINLTNQPEAARVVLEQLVVELLRRPDVSLAAPGAVEQALTELRIRDTGALTLDQSRALGEKLSSAVLLTGTVNDYKQEADGGRPLPVVSVNLRAVDAATGRVVWACAHTRTGSDSETVFGIGRVTSLPDLTSTVVGEMVSTMPRGGRQ